MTYHRFIRTTQNDDYYTHKQMFGQNEIKHPPITSCLPEWPFNNKTSLPHQSTH